MKVSVYIDQVLFNQALKAAKGTGMTPSQKIAHWAEIWKQNPSAR
ncbi:hypothetical protein AB6E06_23425 [Vibrio splendidus]